MPCWAVWYYHKFRRDLSKRICPITSLLRKGVKFESMPAMEVIVPEVIAELAALPILVFPDWDAVADGSRPFRVLRRVHRRFWGCTRIGATGRLSAAHRLHEPCYHRF